MSDIDNISIKSDSTINENIDDFDDDNDEFDIIYKNKYLNNIIEEKKLKIFQVMKNINAEKNIVKNINLKHKFISIKHIADLLKNNFNGSIFGGYIRDLFLHNNGSFNYYEEYSKYLNDNQYLIKKKKSYQFLNINIIEHDNVLYNNKNFHNESYIERNTIPNDIDIVLHEEDYQHFLKFLNENFKHNYTFKNHENFNKYMKINDSNHKIKSFHTVWIDLLNPVNDLKKKISYYEFTNLGLGIISNEFTCARVKIQIFTCDKNTPKKDVLNILTNGADFFCNSLYYGYDNKINISIKNMNIIDNKIVIFSKYNDKIKKNLDKFLQYKIYKTKILDIVLKQIFERKAFPIDQSTLMYKRIKKMKKKHFKIYYETLYFTKNIEINNNEICILCRDKIDLNDIISMKCCNSYYHRKCMREICSNIKYKNNVCSCFMCKKYIDFKYVRKHINI